MIVADAFRDGAHRHVITSRQGSFRRFPGPAPFPCADLVLNEAGSARDMIPPADTGIDLHTKESQICIQRAKGEPIEQRVRTTPARFADVLGDRPRARIVLEASTDSEWAARCLEGFGHEILVAQRHVRGRLTVRDALVRTRTGYIGVIRARLRQHGWRVASGSAEGFIRRVLALRHIVGVRRPSLRSGFLAPSPAHSGCATLLPAPGEGRRDSLVGPSRIYREPALDMEWSE